MIANAARIFYADSLLLEPKLEYDNKATRGTIPKRRIFQRLTELFRQAGLHLDFH